MALFLSNEDVRKLLTTAECVDVLDDLFHQEAQGLVENLPRRRYRFEGRASGTLMGGTALGSHAWGVRHSSVTLLYNTESGKLDAVIQPSAVAWIRTGAASGLATRYMARPDASVVGVIGSGHQAITQLEGVCAVRPVKQVKVFSRTPEHRESFAKEAEDQLGVEVVPVASADDCVRGSQIVITITNSREPVFDGELLEPGTHINAAGSNSFIRRELDETTIRRADRIVVDNLEQAKMECGELLWAAERGAFHWQQAVELHDVVGGLVSGRPGDEAITLFESQGIGIEDTAASAYVLRKAREQGIGQDLPF
jgi:ornithine cyclodeaminase/alanine dehydrogenase-like protein (mu-crystallin family)